MNKHLHRIVFSAARGMRMAVQETAMSAGKATGATSGVVATALAGLLAVSPAPAQIVGAPGVAPNLRPTVLLAPNGVPLVNIQTPSAAGVSRNLFNQFDVQRNGAILNNSRTDVQTQLGGFVQGNPYLATGPARIILNEITSGNPTQLRGYVEVGGQRAEVIIANPAGIAVDGGGFINASRATLTTGIPQFNAAGGLDSFVVRGGTISIDGAGLDLSRTDYSAILARAVQVNAGIWANELKVVTGANQVSADHGQISPTTGTGPTPTFALDVAQLGGMYAGKITLIGTEAGLGARNAGTIQAANGAGTLAGAGQLVVTAAGRLENIGTLQATAGANLNADSLANSGRIASGGELRIATQGTLGNAGGTLEGPRVELTSAGGDIDNRGGTIRQTSSVGLTVAAPSLSNTAGGVIGAEPIPEAPSQPSPGAGTGGTGTGGTTDPGQPATGDGGGTGTGGSGGTAPSQPYVPPAPGSLTAAGAILNDGGRIYAGGPITLQTPQVNNNGGSLATTSLAASGPRFSNVGGTVNVANNFSAHVDHFDNTGGSLRAGSLNIVATGDLVNQDGKLESNGDASLGAGGSLDNTRGTVSAAGSLTANASGALNNTAGTLLANQGITVGAQSLTNSKGSIQSATAGTRLTVTNQLLNAEGTIGAATDLSVQAGSLSNSGSLRGSNDTTIDVADALVNDGSITAGRNTAITAGSLQSPSTSSGEAVLGAGIQADGKLGSIGDLRVTTTGALVATGTHLAAGDAVLQGASMDLSSSTTSAANIALTATQGNVATSNAAVVTPGTLSVSANARPGQALVNDAGTLNAGQLDLRASNIANTHGGEIVQTGTGATAIATSGAIDNTGSRIATNGQDLTLQAASITNTGGKIEHAGSGSLSIGGGSYSGANGQITGNGALFVNLAGAFNQDGGNTYAKQITIDAGALSNQGGKIVQAESGDTRISVVGALNNYAGTIASNGHTTVAAGSLSNQGGTIRAAEASNLGLTVGAMLDNSSKGGIGAGGDVALNAGSLNNDDGRIIAVGDLSSTTTNGATSNQAGTIAANGNTTLNAGSLNNNNGGAVAAVTGQLQVATSGATTNAGGNLQAGGAAILSNAGLDNSAGKVFGNSLSVDTHGQALTNALGTIAATGMVDVRSGALNNNAGLVQSGGAMTIDTHGQALTNTNAAGYATGQGGITSSGTLTLASGALDNTAGFIGAKDALVAHTGAVTNAGGGIVLGQGSVSIDTHGAGYDNRGGQMQAAGDLRIDAGAIDNTGALIRSLGTTTLNAGTLANANTLSTDRGIEGKNVSISTGTLINNVGAIRADDDTTITTSGGVDNNWGLISAGNALRIVDPNAANPAAKTLSLTNTNGKLVADKNLQIDAATFSGDGQAVSGKDLSIALTQDAVNNAEVAANGSLSYTTTGNFTNNGKLLAGETLTVGGNNVENTAGAEMSGKNTIVNAGGTLTNRGLIDSNGATQINAGTVNNVGSGRIYGDAISIAAGTLNNDAETVNGVTKAATIAARSSLDIGASTINNREHALIFSAGDMFIGGALDANRYATGQGATLNNHSATIESLGNMAIAMGTVNNWDTHLQVGQQTTHSTTSRLATMDGKFWDRSDTWGDDASRFVFHRNADGSVVVVGSGWGIWDDTIDATTDYATHTDPARLVAGGNIDINGFLHNRDSQVLAGGTITAAGSKNEATQGTQTSTVTTLVTGYMASKPGTGPNNFTLVGPTTSSGTVNVGSFRYESNYLATSGAAPGSAASAAVNANAGGTGDVNGGTRPGAIVEVPANVGAVVKTSGTGADAAAGAGGANSTGSSRNIPMVVRTSTPNTTIPSASLFGIHAGPGGYLVETDPRFANYRQWLSSDYLLNALGMDPNYLQKRLGDGFYEQKLIREQVAQLTGYRYLDGFYSDEEQYTALMNAGATFAKEYGLKPGIALTAAQMAQLTSDIVWLVEQTVTLPDGSTQQVLVPQVYVRVRPGDIDGSGALLSADAVKIKSNGDVANTGTIAGRTLVAINADNINNLGGRISGGNVALEAVNDLNNIGGTIDARDSLSLKAGRDINVRTTTTTNSVGLNSTTSIDRVAGLYVTNPGGTLVASAGHDVNLIGAILENKGPGGYTSITAKNDINLGTVRESTTVVGVGIGSNNSMTASSSRELGTTIASNGTTILNAGRDVNARQATVDAGNGLLTVHAERDINIASGQTQTSGSFSAQWTDKGVTRSTDNKLSSEFASSTSVGSSFSGGLVSLGAKNDIYIEGSHISGTQGVMIDAGRNLGIVEGRNTTYSSAEQDRKTSGVSGLLGMAVGAPITPVLPFSKTSKTGIELQSDTASASTVTSSQGGVLLQGGTVNMVGVQVDAAKDIAINGGQVYIQAATNTSSVTGTSSTGGKGLTANQFIWHDPSTGINAKRTITTEIQDSTLTRTTLNGTNVTISAADTLAMFGTTVNASGALTLNADTLLLGTQTTEHSQSETSQGRDLGYQKTKDKGTQDQTTHYNQFNAVNLAVNANHVQAGIGARDSVEQLAKQPGMGWVEQLNNDPKLQGKIDWVKVEEAHKNWNHEQQGLTPEGAAIVTLVVAYFTAGAASGAGATAGEAAAVATGQGIVVEGAVFAAGSTVGAVVGGAVTAGLAALASQAAVALINNQFDIGATLNDLGSSASVKNLLTAIVTGGALGGLNLDPTGLPTAGGGAQGFMTQLGQNLTAGAARAVIGTAINGGSLEENLKEGLKSAILDTIAAQGANAIGDNLDGFANKVAHAIAGCAVGAAKADSASGCGAGALGAAIGEIAAEAYGRQADTVQFAGLMSGLAVAIAGGDASQINIGSQAGSNAAANNFLNHPDAVKARQLTEACKTQCTPAQREQLATLLQQDKETNEALNACAGSSSTLCNGVREDFKNAATSFMPNDDDIWNWSRQQSDASDGKYTAVQIYDAYRTNFIQSSVPNMTVGDLTEVADWMRGRIVGGSEPNNPGEGPLSRIAMGWAVGNSASAQGALGAATMGLAGAIRAGALAAGPYLSAGAVPLSLADTQSILTQQIGDLRGTLTGSARTGGNVGVAQIDIPGIQPTMAASSRITNPTSDQRALGFVGQIPETFPSSVVPTGSNPPLMLNRAVDSEAKILNNIAAQLRDNTSATGTINLLTERAPCVSCSNVIQQFEAKYPNIKINVLDNGGKVVPPTRRGG
ncbi:filamentous hemagglutinin family N-terminal domain-containing protein [Variovorax sp. CF079]|uniref:two-partner secretion domain-containing protein n=1 Tax=Variovorax sp. CF079 TaxID=1882774 RepID=UPI0008818623|nr:deaminase domain-containing protein [Variovorax sp. CF079]SDC49890.1 filamentous hemagglutinin family N-terminal domain-containing protein [Variovorax sp. CF079]